MIRSVHSLRLVPHGLPGRQRGGGMRAELLDLLAALEEESGLPQLFDEDEARVDAARDIGRQILANFANGSVFRAAAKRIQDPQKKRAYVRDSSRVMGMVDRFGLSPSQAYETIQREAKGGRVSGEPRPDNPPPKRSTDAMLENRRARTAAANVLPSEVALQTKAEKRQAGMRKLVLTDPQILSAAEAEQKQRQVAAGKAAADPTHVRAIALMTARQQPTFSAEELPRQTAAVRKLFSENYKVALRDASR
jgi:hypothetical protein